MKYDHKQVEKKWQDIWDEKQCFHAENDSDKEKFYALVEFPYPSGQGLHVGHPRSYTALEDSSILLPLRQALAIAADQEGGELSIGYADSGSNSVRATWLLG